MLDSEVCIIVATYGDDPKWDALANRAVESTHGQGAKVLRIHGDTLASARNEAAQYANSNWLIFLDADDELSPGYVVAMLKAGEGDIRKPSTLGVVNGKEDDYPVMIPKRNLRAANHIVIGAMVRCDLFRAVGGFRELSALEDWDLFQRMVLAGGVVTEVCDAVYRVHVNGDGRNSNTAAHRSAYIEVRNFNREAWLKYDK